MGCPRFDGTFNILKAGISEGDLNLPSDGPRATRLHVAHTGTCAPRTGLAEAIPQPFGRRFLQRHSFPLPYLSFVWCMQFAFHTFRYRTRVSEVTPQT